MGICELSCYAIRLMSPPNQNSIRKGFTLLELSLVLAILVIVSAIAAPRFVGTLEQERLRKAAESVGADWTRTRALAMQTGETQLWACKLGTGQFAISLANPDLNVGGEAGTDVSIATSATDLLSQNLTETLPTDVVISQALISESDSITTMSLSTETSDSGTATMFFYPDGTCSAARLTLNKQDDPDSTMTVMINGLAGTVRVLHGGTSSGAAQ